MVRDALRDVVVHPERGGAGNPDAVLVLLRRLHVAAGRAGSLDSEQVVVRRGEPALPPARFVDGLGDGDRGRDAVPLLGRDRSWRHHGDERLLGGGARHAGRRRVVPAVGGSVLAPGPTARRVRQHLRARDGGAARRGRRLAAATERCHPRHLGRVARSLRAARSGLAVVACRADQFAVVDESEHALAGERGRELVRVDREVRQRVAADGVQGGAGIPGDHLDVPVEQHPVARLRLVTVAERVPAMMRLRVLQHRHHVRRCRVGLDADIGPLMQRPRVGAASGHPALLARSLGAERQREAGERRA